MARKTEKQVKQTRRNLIDAARIHFLADSFSHASLEKIAATAGVTRGAIYSQFPQGKKALFEAVYADLESRIEEEKQALRKQKDFGLEVFLHWWLNAIREDGSLRQRIELDFQKILISNHAQFHDQHNHKLSEIYDELFLLVQKSQEQNRIKPHLSVQNLTMQLVSMLTGITIMLHFQDWSHAQIQAREDAMDAWLKMITINGDK